MPRRQLFTLLACVALVVCGAALRRASAHTQNPSHPDTQKLLMENQFVRVFEIKVPAGVFEPRHQHARGLTIALSDYETETKNFTDGRVGRGQTTFGTVRWAEPQDHEVRNVGTTEQHVIRIELK